MMREDICARIEEVGIMPSVRVSGAELALFAAETVYEAGIPVVEITMTVPNAVAVIAELTQNYPSLIVGAGTVLDVETARKTLRGRRRAVYHQPRARSGRPGIYAQEWRSRNSRCDDSLAEVIAGMEGGSRFCEDLPLCSGGWRSIHSRAEDSIAARYL